MLKAFAATPRALKRYSMPTARQAPPKQRNITQARQYRETADCFNRTSCNIWAKVRNYGTDSTARTARHGRPGRHHTAAHMLQPVGAARRGRVNPRALNPVTPTNF